MDMSHSTDATSRPAVAISTAGWLLLVGLAVMFVPTIVSLAQDLWLNNDQTQGPVLLAVAAYLLWSDRAVFAEPARPGVHPLTAASFAIGLVMYVIGRSQGIFILEVGSSIAVVGAAMHFHGGAKLLRKTWFSLLLLAFLIPLPGAVVQYLTMPMKTAISYGTEHILYWFGYPIARSGVTIHIGQYHLLVADACAGLHTVFTLEAMGLIYLKVFNRTSVVRNTVLALLIVPIGFIANVIRVMSLVLITYHFGDEAGQGFLHGFAGLVLFMSAFLLIVTVDKLLQRGSERRSPHVPVLAETVS